jgi:hypothetical protein
MAEGQYTGKTAVYVYKDDNDVNYLIRLDKTLGDLTQCGLVAATDANLSLPTLPKRFQVRRVMWQGKVSGILKSKRLTCSRTSTAYAAAGSTKFEIDGSTEGSTTGRVGEKKTYLRIPVAVVP